MKDQLILLKYIHGFKQSKLLISLSVFGVGFVYIQFLFYGSGYLYFQLFFSALLLLGIVLFIYLAATDIELVFDQSNRSFFSRSLLFGRKVVSTSKPFYLDNYDYIYIPKFDAHGDGSGRYYLTLFSTKIGEQALFKVDVEDAEKELDRISTLFCLPSKGFLDHVGFSS